MGFAAYGSRPAESASLSAYPNSIPYFIDLSIIFARARQIFQKNARQTARAAGHAHGAAPPAADRSSVFPAQKRASALPCPHKRMHVWLEHGLEQTAAHRRTAKTGFPSKKTRRPAQARPRAFFRQAPFFVRGAPPPGGTYKQMFAFLLIILADLCAKKRRGGGFLHESCRNCGYLWTNCG